MIEQSRTRIFDAFDPAASEEPDARRRLRIIFDLAFALANGLLSDEVFSGGFDAIDHFEWSDWMYQNGCKKESLDSAIVRGCYDYAFAPRKPGIGAGTATILVLRFLLTYKGSVLHELAEPMGDFLFAPMYLYLKEQKNVKFEFFTRVDKLVLDSDGFVGSVEIGQQVELKAGVTQYDPLINRKTDGRPSWPSAPKAELIKNGEWLQPGVKYQNPDLESDWTDWPDAKPARILQRRTAAAKDDDKDTFDLVILGLGFDGLRRICDGFRAKLPAWKGFLGRIETTQTVALQLWLLPTTVELGWPDTRTALTGFEKANDKWPAAPLTSWEDNTGLLQQEEKRPGKQPGGLAYFCGVFPDAAMIPPPKDPTYSTFPAQQRERAWTATFDWMNDRLAALWPKAATGSSPRFDEKVLETFDAISR